MKLSDKLLPPGEKLRRGTAIDDARAKQGVTKTLEWRRIFGLPVRSLDFARVEDLTALFRREYPDCYGCELCRDGGAKLRPVQSAILWEAERARGLLAAVGVGHGKELACLLLPEALRAERAVIITKPRLKSQMLEIDLPRYGRHFRIQRERFRVLSYSELSTAKGTGLLEALRPDLIVANEAHCFRHSSSARTKRFLRYMKEHPETIFCGLSGTIANDSPRDYQHLMELALRGGSPVPIAYRDADDWSRALEAGGDFAPGALLELMGPSFGYEVVRACGDDTRMAARTIYRARMTSTAGVVATSDSAAQCDLEISRRDILVPPNVRTALSKIRATWTIEDEELQDAKDVARVARQLACGFYYRWAWPNGEKDHEWLYARAEWHKSVRHVLRYQSREGLDSPLLVANAAARGELAHEHLVAWDAWSAVRDRWKPHPPVEAVWLSSFLIDDVWAWSREVVDEAPAIIWYEHVELGVALAHRGIPVFGPGKEGDAITTFRGRVCAASVEAHKDGKNLQHFRRNLVLTWPANGTTCEQLLGRTHRPGQEADEVEVELYQHDLSLVDAVAKSREDARFVEEAHGARQKLLMATWIGFDF